MDSGFLEISDPKWGSLLDRLDHDFYHLPAYVGLAAAHEGGKPIGFWAEEGERAILIPLLVKELPESLEAPREWRNAQSPYGYPSPLVTRSCDEAVVLRFLAVFKEACRQWGVVSVFLRLHPLLRLPIHAENGLGQLMFHGHTVYLDLRLDVQELWRQTWSGHRSDIKRLQKSGYRTVVDDWSFYPEFVSAYQATMRRVNAGAAYFFPQVYFDDLRHALGDRLHLGTVLSPSGETMAAGLFPCSNGVMQYHLSGSAERSRTVPATKLLLHSMTAWAKENGCFTLHLGGGVGARQDSLFKFKAGFSPLLADFYSLRLIVDDGKYRTLVETWRRRASEPAAGDFFPGYRAPVVCRDRA